MASKQCSAQPEGNVTNIAEARLQTKKKSGTKAAPKKAKSESNRRFNHEKVARIKAAIANGTYTIDAQRIADKFIEKESP